jgi:hypothetical protein
LRVTSEIQKSHEGLILKTIEEVLINVFGRKTFNKMLLIMKKKYELEWREIPRRSEEFSLALHHLLGNGSMIIEDLIVESLYEALGLEIVQKRDLPFYECISQLTSRRNRP